MTPKINKERITATAIPAPEIPPCSEGTREGDGAALAGFDGTGVAGEDEDDDIVEELLELELVIVLELEDVFVVSVEPELIEPEDIVEAVIVDFVNVVDTTAVDDCVGPGAFALVDVAVAGTPFNVVLLGGAAVFSPPPARSVLAALTRSLIMLR